MPEPQISPTAVIVAGAAPFTGQYAVIVFAALAGALWPLAAAKTATRLEAAMLLVRLVGTAAALTYAVAWLLEQKAGVPASVALSPVAFLIAAIGNRWGLLFDEAVERARRVIRGGNGGAGQ